MQASLPLHSLNPRSELRLAFLAGAEACWLYAIVLTLGTMAGLPREVSPLGIFVVYWVGLTAGRVLPRMAQAWRLLQALTVVTAFLAILVAMRIGLYTETSLLDFSWLAGYGSRIFALFEHLSPEVLSTVLLLFAFVRGLDFAQRPLTLWVVGFQFRLGIVIFFVLSVFGVLSTRVEFTFWIFMYFAFSLLGIALARIEDAGQTGRLGGRWAGVMGSMLAVVLLAGLGLTQLLTLRVVNAIFAFLSPLAIIGEAILLAIAIPFIYLLDFIFRTLAPLLRTLSDFLSRIFPTQTQSNNPATFEALDAVLNQLANLVPYLRLLGIILVVGLVAWWIARMLNKRMDRVEEDMVARETLSDTDTFARGQEPRLRPRRSGPREVHAENIRRIYAALQAQAEALGLPRREAETPNEYLPRLAAEFPRVGMDLEAITSAYVAVHYAQQTATDGQVRELRTIWLRVREQMRDVKKNSKP